MTPKKRRGRPRIEPTDRSVDVHLTLPGRQFDAYARLAVRQGCSIPATIRAALPATPAEKNGRKN